MARQVNWSTRGRIQLTPRRASEADESLDMSSGLSILLLRPQLLLSSLHNLVLLTAFRLAGETHDPPLSSLNFDELSSHMDVEDPDAAIDRLGESLRVNQEVMDKIRGMEAKLGYQIKKLSALAEAEEARGKAVIEDAEEGKFSRLRYTPPRGLSHLPIPLTLCRSSCLPAQPQCNVERGGSPVFIPQTT